MVGWSNLPKLYIKPAAMQKEKKKNTKIWKYIVLWGAFENSGLEN